MHGLSSDATPVAYVPGVVLAALGSLPFGAVLGPELPVIALGTAVGVLANRFARLSGREAAVLTNAGSFSAISALFGGPLVAGVLLVEGGLSAGAALIPVLLPGWWRLRSATSSSSGSAAGRVSARRASPSRPCPSTTAS